MSDEINKEISLEKSKVKEKIKEILKDPLKFNGYSFLIFSFLTLVFYFASGPDFLKIGSFIITTFTGIMCWSRVKFDMRMYYMR